MDFNKIKKVKSDSITFSTDSKILTINGENEEMTIWDKYKDETICWQDLDNNGKYDTKVIVSEKKQPRIFKLDEKQNSVLQIQKQMRQKLDKESKQEYLDEKSRYKKFGIDINGKIDSFEQGDEAADCWLLAGLKGFSLSVSGQRTIKKAISQDAKGNVTVYLKGAKESYTFSPEEIIKAEKRLSKGDDDVRVIEMAIEQHRLKLIKGGNGVKIGTPSKPDLDKRIGSGSLEIPLDYGNSDEINFLLTGKKSKYYHSSWLTRLFDKGFSSDVKGCLSKIQNNQGKYVATTTFKTDKGRMTTEHEYTIAMVDNDYVMIVNPWDSLKYIKIKKEDFIDNYSQITLSDISK